MALKGLLIAVLLMGLLLGCTDIFRIGRSNENADTRYEPLLPFAVNGFAVAFKVAEVRGIDTPEELEAHLHSEVIPYFLDLGAAWGRVHPGAFGSFAWGAIDPDRDGQNFDFTLQDLYVRVAQENGIQLLPSLSPLKPSEPAEWTDPSVASYVPEDIEAYKAYVRATVERYDGDGSQDMAGLLLPVKHWQLDNEADLRNRQRDGGFSGFLSPAEYQQILAVTYEAMQAADAKARLMINLAGLGQGATEYGLEYLQRLMAEGAWPYFEILSYHVYPTSYAEAAYESELAAMKSLVEDRPIWITETAITSRDVRGFQDPASESAQARWLAKSYVYHVTGGVTRLFWLRLTDASPATPERVAKYGGLMTFGPPPEEKASYHTFRLLAGKLNAATNASSEGRGRYVFRFADGRRIYVLWSSISETVDLSGALEEGTALVTHIVEDASRPDPMTEQVPASAVPVGPSPVLVEAAQ